MAHPDIDPASLQLLIRLQLEEANALLASAGDGDGASADVNVALRLYVGELESLSTPQPAPVVASPVADTASSITETQTIASRATTAQPPSESITTSRSVRRTSLFGRLLAAATTRTVVQVTEPQEANTQVAPAAASVSRTGSSIPQSRTTAESQVATTRQSTAPTQDTYVQIPAHSMPRSRTTSSTGQARTPTTDRNTVAGTTGARLPSLSTSGDANANLRRKRQRAPGPSDLSDRLQVKIKKEEEEEEESLFVTDLKSTPKRPRLIKRESDSEERHGIGDDGSSDLANGRTTGASGTNTNPAANVSGATAENSPSKMPKIPVKTIVCTACTEEVPTRYAAIGACGHRYCRSCTQRLFDDAIGNDSAFPPKCCQLDLPIRSARKLLRKSAKAKFAEKEVEHATPNKTYCSGCSAFIHPAVIIGDLAQCTSCLVETCTKCKNKKHVNQDCPEDEGAKQLHDLAARKRWKACPECKFMVSKVDGCNHISCRCGHQFCYRCAEQWSDIHHCLATWD